VRYVNLALQKNSQYCLLLFANQAHPLNKSSNPIFSIYVEL
jgi:hypothetical protein